MFVYSAGARQRGLKDITFGFGLSAVCGGLLAMIYVAADVSFIWSVVGLALAIFALAGAVFLCGGIARLLTGGSWQIELNTDGVDWQAPPVAEKSFCYGLEQICSIERRIRRKERKDGSAKEKQEYVLISKDGDEHRLTHQSGVDLEAFVEAAKSLGVAFTERTVPYRKRRDL